MSLKCQWFSPMAKKLRPRVKICGQVGLTALPPSDKNIPPQGFPQGFDGHPCGRRLNRMGQKRPYFALCGLSGYWVAQLYSRRLKGQNKAIKMRF